MMPIYCQVFVVWFLSLLQLWLFNNRFSIYIYNRGLKAWFAISILLKRLGNQSIFYSGVLLQFLLLFIARFAISISTHCLICKFYFTHTLVCNSLFLPIAWFFLEFPILTYGFVCNSLLLLITWFAILNFTRGLFAISNFY